MLRVSAVRSLVGGSCQVLLAFSAPAAIALALSDDRGAVRNALNTLLLPTGVLVAAAGQASPQTPFVIGSASPSDLDNTPEAGETQVSLTPREVQMLNLLRAIRDDAETDQSPMTSPVPGFQVEVDAVEADADVEAEEEGVDVEAVVEVDEERATAYGSRRPPPEGAPTDARARAANLRI